MAFSYYTLLTCISLLTQTQAFLRDSVSARTLESGSAEPDRSWPTQKSASQATSSVSAPYLAPKQDRDISISAVEGDHIIPVEPTQVNSSLGITGHRQTFLGAVETITIFPTVDTERPSLNLNRTQSVTREDIPDDTELSPETAVSMGGSDIFSEPIDTRPPPSMMKVQSDHPVQRIGVVAQPPLQTNKFYANFFLGDQRGPTYTFPYSIAWAGGKGAAASWGMICSHIEAKQRVFGESKSHGASAYFLSPVGIESMVMSAKELGKETALTVDSVTAFSARVHLSKKSDTPPVISFPLVQGMAYVTAEFNEATPILQSGVYFKTVTKVTKDPKPNLTKFNFNLEDGSTWRLYAWRTKGEKLDLQVVNNSFAEAKKPFTGVIQITKDPMTPGSEDELDDGAGIYPVTLDLSGTASGVNGTYSFKYRRDGHDTGNLYMYALPHHLSSFSDETKGRIQKTRLQSTTKGMVSLVKGTEWTMVEPRLPTDMEFAPWHPEKGSMKNLSDHAKDLIHGAASKEVAQNMIAQTNLDSMYFSGKVSPLPTL